MLTRFFKLFVCLTPFFSITLHAEDPWFTGPLLANASATVERGHLNVEPYAFYFVNEGLYSRNPKAPDTPAEISTIILPQVILGLTDALDVQIDTTYNHNVSVQKRFNEIGDTSIMFGFQVLRQGNQAYKPDLRFTIQETIPTGRFEDLNPLSNGTEATGLGSYQTDFGLNFGKLSEPFLGHFLTLTLNLNYLYAQKTTLSGLNTYGGTPHTSGEITPGNLMSLDFAGELTITQNWVIVLETYIAKRDPTLFNGQVTRNDDELGLAGNDQVSKHGIIGNDQTKEYSLAPALEYNFSNNLGIIAGVWFSLGGQNGPNFTSPALAINWISD